MDPGFGRNEDRISMLPDSMLTHILSCLPTKDVMGTNILSKRWENVWNGVRNLDFDDTQLLEKSKKLIEDRRETLDRSFVQHVNRVLLLTEVQRLERFSLVLRKLLNTSDYEKVQHNNHFLNLWISSAIKLNVQEMYLCLLVRLRPASLPRVLFTSETLRHLDLEMEGVPILVVPAAVWLPNLKFLRLKAVRYKDENAALRLFNGCPVLENLFLIRAPEDDCVTLRIFIPTLKLLSVESEEPTNFKLLNGVGERRVYMININYPNLEKLFLKDLFLKDINGENLSKVYEAEIDVGLPFSIHSIRNFLNGIATIKILRLFGNLASIFGNRYTVLPMYRNLISLELSPICTICINFLESCPNLEVLILKKGAIFDFDSFWNPPTQVPECLVSHLKKITITRFQGLKDELVAIEYLIRNAEVLKKITISGEMMAENVRMKLECFPRGCKNCEVHILSGGFISESIVGFPPLVVID